MALLKSRFFLCSVALHGGLGAALWSLSFSISRESTTVTVTAAIPDSLMQRQPPLESTLLEPPVELDPEPVPVLEPPVEDEPLPEPEEDVPAPQPWLRLTAETPVLIKQRPQREPAPEAPPTTAEEVEKPLPSFELEVLDAEDLVLFGPEPGYPRRAVQRSIEGTVILLAQVDREGQVTGCEIEQSSGSDLLDQAAMDALLKWRFRPRVVQGMVRPFVARATFQFVLPTE